MKIQKLNSKSQPISFETENNIEKAIKIWHNGKALQKVGI